MDRKLIINLCLLIAVACVAGIIWTGMGPVAPDRPSPAELERARALDRVVVNEISGEEEIEGWKPEGVSMGGKVLVGICLLFVVAGYAAIVFVSFVLPRRSRVAQLWWLATRLVCGGNGKVMLMGSNPGKLCKTQDTPETPVEMQTGTVLPRITPQGRITTPKPGGTSPFATFEMNAHTESMRRRARGEPPR